MTSSSTHYDAIATAKQNLLEALSAATTPKALPKPSDEFESYISALEALNPTEKPTEAGALLDGCWRTLYTTSTELLNIGKAIPGFHCKNIYQCIWAEAGLLANIGEVDGLPFLGGIVAVRAQFFPQSDRRVKVKFLQAMVGSQTIMNYDLESMLVLMEQQPKQIPALKITFPPEREQKGWLDITYLDDNIRIGRGNQGNVFVLEKV